MGVFYKIFMKEWLCFYKISCSPVLVQLVQIEYISFFSRCQYSAFVGLCHTKYLIEIFLYSFKLEEEI